MTFDSARDEGSVVHNGNVSQHVFKPSKKGLHYSDMKDDTRTILVTTVDKIKYKYSVRQYSSAKRLICFRTL